MMAEFLKKKVLKFLWARRVVDIYILRPEAIPQVLANIMKVMDIGLLRPSKITRVIAEVVEVGQVRPKTLPLVIVKDMLIKVDLGHKRSENVPLEIREQEFMLEGDVDICLQPATIDPLTKANMVDC